MKFDRFLGISPEKLRIKHFAIELHRSQKNSVRTAESFAVIYRKYGVLPYKLFRPYRSKELITEQIVSL